jgi:hypothetical protein
VNYLVDDDDVLTILSLRRRAWWRNLRGGAPLTALLAGRERQGRGSLPATDTTEAADQLRRLYAAAGHPISHSRAAALAPERVVVRVELDPPATAPNAVLRGRRLWRRWTATVTVGETIAFALPATTGALVTALGLSRAPSTAALLLAGLGEGLVLGLAQALVVRRALPDVRSRDWIRATAMGAGLAWAVALLPTVIGSGLADLSPFILVPGGLVLGVIFLLSIGTLQWRVLRAHVRGAGRWVPAVAASWLAGLGTFMAVAAPLWREGQPPVLIALIGLLAGLAMAFVMALVSGLALARIVGR